MAIARNGNERRNELALVEAIRAGDLDRFDELYSRYHGRVLGFAMRRVKNRSDAEDIAQEVFLQVYRSISSFEGRASLATWIFGIAHNVTCRHYRRRGAESVSLDATDAAESIGVHPITERRIDAARAVQKCTEALQRSRTPEHMEIFRQFYGNGRPLRVIAHATGKPTDSVKDSLRRSRNMLLRDVPDVRSALSAVHAVA